MREPLYHLSPSADTTTGSIIDRAVWRTCPDCKERVNACDFAPCVRCGHEACSACNLDWADFTLAEDDDDYSEGITCRRCRGD